MGIKRRRCAVIARTRPELHHPLSGCSWARAAGLRLPLFLCLGRQLPGVRAAGGFVCALTVLHGLVGSVVFLQGVLLAGTLQRDTGPEAEKFYRLVTDSLNWLRRELYSNVTLLASIFLCKFGRNVTRRPHLPSLQLSPLLLLSEGLLFSFPAVMLSKV